jgi:hypothetical protein
MEKKNKPNKNKVAFSYPHKLRISLFYVLVLVIREQEPFSLYVYSINNTLAIKTNMQKGR